MTPIRRGPPHSSTTSSSSDTATTSSGLPALGEVSWGSHFCHLFRHRSDLLAVLIPYFAAGLRAAERCLWVTAPPLPADAARAGLVAALGESEVAAAEQRGQLEIVAHDRTLTVKGKVEQVESEGWIRRGIARESFERRFALGEHVRVAGAKLELGVLHIELTREVPEALKPRTIAIGAQAQAA